MEGAHQEKKIALLEIKLEELKKLHQQVQRMDALHFRKRNGRYQVMEIESANTDAEFCFIFILEPGCL